MKKIVSLMVAMFVLTTFTMVYAENRAGSSSVALTAGGYAFEGNQDYKNNVALGVRGGYNFTENWGTELYFNYVPSEYKDTGADNEVYVAGVEGLYHFMPKSQVVPFLAVGVGAIHYSSGDRRLVPSKITVDYGAGLKVFLTDNIALRADVRHILPLGESGKYGDNPHKIHNDLLATFGLQFAFGGCCDKESETVTHDAPPAPVVYEDVRVEEPPVVDMTTDSDRDGVPDYIDECPGSPASVVVDNKGCPRDSDGDGVLDYQDKCPNTPAGVSVDTQGCPPDSDNDGVVDTIDKCPNTRAGAVVAKDGCVYEKVSTLLKVEFDSGKTVVKKQYHKEMNRVADFMKANPTATATIVGHTDAVGNDMINFKLSQARAESVREYIIKKFGISGSRIRALGYGPHKPIADNRTKEGRQKNRRVVALFETIAKR
jgi:OOP family OmpA-OmpF porin